jgi:DNA-binding response OmpR family regulator
MAPRPSVRSKPSSPTSSSSTSCSRTSRGSTSAATSGGGARRSQSSSSARRARRSTSSSGWRSELTTTSSSPSGRASSWRGLSIDINERRVFRDDTEVNLTHTEFDLLAYLASNAGKVLSREKILNAVWGYDYPIETRVIDVHVRNLRRKIEPDPSHPLYILAVPGVGYRFAALRP